VAEAWQSGYEETRTRHEQAGQQHDLDWKGTEEEREKSANREQMERNRRRELQAQAKKLRDMGICVMGYRWIEQPGPTAVLVAATSSQIAQLRL
jgi:hypothetical protein